MKIKLEYNENPIPVLAAIKGYERIPGEKLNKSKIAYNLWKKVKPGESFSKVHSKKHWFGHVKTNPNNPFHTLVASDNCGRLHYKWDKPEILPYQWWTRAFTFPDDFKFKDTSEARYTMGMSVPPFMVQRVAVDVGRQLLGVEKMNELKTGPWKLSDLDKVEKIGRTVFSCFSCGGGSTMGYKLAGYDVLGCCEIDPQMMKIYKANHNPKYSYLMGVQEFKNIPDEELPEELFNLDILDGSPPCSSFSMAGSREKKWGKKKKFREGQAEQVLDDLFFDFIDIAEKLKPKVVVAENVKGLIQGNARGYVKQIFKRFKEIGYSVQLFLLNAAAMGVPQKRERVFFIANRIDAPKIEMEFSESKLTVKQAAHGIDPKGNLVTGKFERKQWELAPIGKGAGKNKGYNSYKKLSPFKISFTQIGTVRHFFWDSCNYISDDLIRRLQTFPDDYRCSMVNYICGMSVPPFMMQRVADQIYKQWFKQAHPTL